MKLFKFLPVITGIKFSSALLLLLFLFGNGHLFAGKEKYSVAAVTQTACTTCLQLSPVTVMTLRDPQYNKYLLNFPNPWLGNTPSSPGGFYDNYVKNRFTLSVDYGDNTFPASNYTASVVFSFTYKYIAGGTFFTNTVTNKTMTIVYNHNPSNISKDKEVWEIGGVSGGAYDLAITVSNILINGSPATTAQLNAARLKFDSEMEIERFYNFDPGIVFNSTDLSHCSVSLGPGGSGELDVFWKAVEGAEEYELEWAHINNYDGTFSGPNTNILSSPPSVDEKYFTFNSTRVSTSNTYYKIPYIYEKGYILYRVRAWGRTAATNYEYNVPGLWSFDVPSFGTSVNLFPNKFPDPSKILFSTSCNNTNEVFVALNENLNWQSSISYAEEGKSKAVVTYHDGSLRNRQSVTKLKSKNEIIIGENIYDFQGRPAIQVLPVPTSNIKIQYVPNFNLVSIATPTPYTAVTFDPDFGGCNSTAPTFTNSVGASNYYSDQNPIKVNENAFIPDAAGYPFSQVEYTPDNTGRIRRQSGVGQTHQLGTDKETKYYYGTPLQKDLDRMFASEVGNKVRYKKNLVIDANGQASISYMDPTGKTIATSLAGNTPGNVYNVGGSYPTTTTSYDLLDKVLPTDNSGLNNQLDIANNKLFMQENILVPANGPYTFTYSVVPPLYQETCSASHITSSPPPVSVTVTDQNCYSCVLDLKITLKDECGKELFTQLFPANTPPTNTVVGTIDSTCIPGPQSTFSKTFTPFDVSNSPTNFLKSGSYTLEKTLSVNEDVLDLYTRNYLDSLYNGCIITLSDFFKSALADIDLSGCGMDCNECLTKLGPYTNYSGPNCKVCLTIDEYNELKDECIEICSEKSTKCETALLALTADLSPAGQYAQYSNPSSGVAGGVISPPAPSSVMPWLYPLSVLNDNNLLPFRTQYLSTFTTAATAFIGGWKPNWRNPYNPTVTDDPLTTSVNEKFAYLDEDGKASYVVIVPDGIGNYNPKVFGAYNNPTYVLPDGSGGWKIEPRYLLNVADFINKWETEWAHSLVAYHPEYCLYERCVEDALSNDFDASYVDIDKVVDINAYLATTGDAFMYPVGKPSSFTTVLDPYFLGTGNGVAKLSEIQNDMVNFVKDPSNNYISIWDFTYKIVNCPNYTTGGICPNCTIPSGHIFTDDEWMVFRGLYMSLKQGLQERINIQYAIDDGCYNQCIGAKPYFNIFDNKFYDPSAIVITPLYSSYWSSFSFWSSLWPMMFYSTTNVSQYYNMEQPCSAWRYYYYKDKQARFPTSKMLMPDAFGSGNTKCYDDLGNVMECPESNSVTIGNMGNLADMAAFQNCGQCPTAVNFEQLLKGLATMSTTASQQDLTNSALSGVQLNCYPTNSIHKEFTAELITQMGFGPANDQFWKYDATSTSTHLKGIVYDNDSPVKKCTLELAMPSIIVPQPLNGYPPGIFTPFTNMYTFADVTDICCLKYNPGANASLPGYSAGNPGNFTCLVTVKTKPGDPLNYPNIYTTSPSNPTFRQILVEGHFSCLDFKNCDFEPVCNTSPEAGQIQNLLNALLYTPPVPPSGYPSPTHFFSSTAVPITVAPYKSFMEPNLIVALDAAIDPASNLLQPWEWRKTTTSSGKTMTGRIKPAPSSSFCDITFNFTVTSLYNIDDIKKIEGIKPDKTSTNPNDYVAYALCRNPSVNGGVSTYEKLYGNISCLPAGGCSKQLPGSLVTTGNTVSNPETIGAEASYTCNLTLQGEQFQGFIKNATSNAAIPPPFPNGVFQNCPFYFIIPEGNGPYNFLGCTFISLLPDPSYTFTPNNHFIITLKLANNTIVSLHGFINCPINLWQNCGPIVPPCVQSGNLIINGDFEKGNMDFVSEYTPQGPNLTFANCASYCGKKYSVFDIKYYDSDPNSLGDHTTCSLGSPCGDGQALKARSEVPGTGPFNPSYVWYENVLVAPNQPYVFSAYLKALHTGNFLTCDLYINDALAVSQSTMISAYMWNKFVFNYTAPTGANPIMTKFGLKIYYSDGTTSPSPPTSTSPGVDYPFLLDDISLEGCMVANSIACELPPVYEIEVEDDCIEDAYNTALETAEDQYNAQIESMRTEFRHKYIAKCLDAFETFDMECFDSEKHYTLYYYDQAGNLVRTVPPQGVNRLPDNPVILSQVKLDRKNNTQTVFTDHSYITTYKYNSLNQLVAQSMPDHQDLNIWNPNPLNGVASGHQVLNMSFNGTNGLLVASNGTNGFLYTFNSVTSTWVLVPSITVSDLTDVLYVSSTEAYAVGKNGMVLHTTNNGTNWDIAPFPDATVNLFKVHGLPSSVEVVVYDKDGNQWQSSVAGTIWTKTTNVFGLSPGEKIIDLDVDIVANTGFATSTFYNYYSYNSGVWTLTTNKTKAVSLNKIVAEPGGTMFATGKDGTLLKFNFVKNKWEEIDNNLTTEIVDMIFISPAIGYVLDVNGNVFRTVNGGYNFITSWGAPTNVRAIAYNTSNAKFYTITTASVVSSYNGTSWSTVSTISPAPPAGTTFHSLYSIGTDVYVGCNSGRLFNYNGTVWTSVTGLSNPTGSTETLTQLYYSAVNAGYILTNAGNIYNIGVAGVLSGLTSVCKSMYFTAATTGYAVSNAGERINISGSSASATTLNASLTNLKSIYANGTNVILAGDFSGDPDRGEIIKASTTGAAFTVQSDQVIPSVLRGVSSIGSNHYAVGMDGTVLKYNSSNTTWETQVTGSNTQLNKIVSANSGINVIAVGNTGASTFNDIIYSTNSGVSWLKTPNTITDLNDVLVDASSNVFVIGKNSTIARSNSTFPPTSGFTTHPPTTPATDAFNAITTNGTELVFAGDKGRIYGGIPNTFVAQNNFNAPVLNDVKWYDNLHVIAVGNGGQIFVSDNAGVNWKQITSGSSQDLHSVDIFNSTTAYVVGKNGTYLRVTYTCSGPSCTYVSLPGTPAPPAGLGDHLTDISILNGSIIISDVNGKVYYKPASGSWSGTTVTSNQLNSISLNSTTHACAVGNNGQITVLYQLPLFPAAASYSNSLSGATPWPIVLYGPNKDLYSVYFKDMVTGYAVGQTGVIMKTVNGGVSWSAESTPVNVGTNNIYAVTSYGQNNVVVGAGAGTSSNIYDFKNEASTLFYYDKLGRLIASQNSKQYAKDPKTYSYTLYDGLGRITEVGEVKANASIESLPGTVNGQVDMGNFASWIAAPVLSNFTEVTNTFYDVPTIPAYDGPGSFVQDNLRNRVSRSIFRTNKATLIEHETYYNYDVHGNVKTLYQNNPTLPSGNRFKRIDYTYDLISGKVNTVSYQTGARDQFYHRYEYDDDNRITNAYSSKDNVIWDQDAKYFYYRHGPLARTELGDLKVQALDYAYTLQGWIKGVNSNKLVPENDMGMDAINVYSNTVNSRVSQDEAGYSLGYYNNDYASIVPMSMNPAKYFLADQAGSTLLVTSNNRQMFNGNISQMVTSIKNFMDANSGKTQANLYSYDQLNRLVSARSYDDFDVANNKWNSTGLTDKYREFLSYDANGNIQTLKRFDDAGVVMDTLTYKYNTIVNGLTKNTNQLAAVQDGITGSPQTDDIESGQSFTINHATDNYQYDNIGNLIHDEQEEIQNIEWTVYGKIKRIIRKTGSIKSDLEFNYDATGNRISKIEKTKNGSGVLLASSNWKYTYYTRDASGNVMAVYTKDPSTTVPGNLYLAEQHIYGSSRLAVQERNVEMQVFVPANNVYKRETGFKSFEVTNHLGNVLTVVSDRKIPVDANAYNLITGAFVSSGADTYIDNYKADLLSANDYYSFGMVMPGRQTANPKYRYGFNGQERDREIGSGSSHLNADYWEYDCRIGLRWNVDPVLKPFESPYAAFSGNPIKIADPSGADGVGDGNTGAITATVYVQFDSDAGLNATQQAAYIANMQNNITGTWNSYTLPNGTPVNANNVQILAAPSGLTGLDANQNLVTVGNGASANPAMVANQTSYVTGGKLNQGYFFLSNGGSEAAHEFGHMLGLSDRYSEGAVYQPKINPTANEAPHGLSGRFTVPLFLNQKQDPTNYNPLNNLMSGSGTGLSSKQLNLIFDGKFNKEKSYPAPCLIQQTGVGLSYNVVGVRRTIMGLKVTPYNGMIPNANYTKQDISWAYKRVLGGFQTFGNSSPEPVDNCNNPGVKKGNRDIIKGFQH